MTNFRMTNRAMMTDPAYLATRARFWRFAPVRATCEHCGDTFAMTTTSRVQKYCSPDCAEEVKKRQQREAYARTRQLSAAAERLKAERAA